MTTTLSRARFVRRGLTAAVATAALASGVLLASPAQADGSVDDRAESALAGAPADTRVLQDVAALDAAPSGEGDVDIPVDPAQGIRLTTSDGASLEVGVPFAEQAEQGVDVGTGAVAYDNANGSITVPVGKTDGSVQITTVIEGPEAPSVYEYTFDSALDLDLFDDGSVVITDVDGAFQGGVAPPWAYDATGAAVDTWYEVNGSSLVQHVAHGAGDAYPVVADPWLGINLFSWITVDSYSGQPRVNLLPSPWGASMWGSAGGLVIMNTAGWDEAWTWNGTVQSALNKPSQRQQFECHALGSPFAGVWNLEKYRPNRTMHWTYGVAVHHCNWTTPNQY